MKSEIGKRSMNSAGIVFFGMLLAVLAGPAWSGTDTGVANDQKSTQASAVDFQQLKQEWGEAVETLKGYSVKQRDKAVANTKTTLDAMDQRLEQLETRAEAKWSDLSRETREQRKAALRSLRKQRNQLAEWYGGIKHSSGDAWEEVKQGFVSAYDALSESMGNAIDEFDTDTAQQ